MAKQQLNGADIGAGFEQMDSKGVSQRMRSNRLAKAGETMCPLAGGLNGGSRYRLTRVAAREQPFLRVCRLPVAAQNIQQLG